MVEVCFFNFLEPDHYVYQMNSLGIVIFSEHRARDFCFLDNPVYHFEVASRYSSGCIGSNWCPTLGQIDIYWIEHI